MGAEAAGGRRDTAEAAGQDRSSGGPHVNDPLAHPPLATLAYVPVHTHLPLAATPAPHYRPRSLPRAYCSAAHLPGRSICSRSVCLLCLRAPCARPAAVPPRHVHPTYPYPPPAGPACGGRGLAELVHSGHGGGGVCAGGSGGWGGLAVGCGAAVGGSQGRRGTSSGTSSSTSRGGGGGGSVDGCEGEGDRCGIKG